MPKVLLIGWDAADWKFINPLLDRGLMPNLESLVNSGVIGNLASLQPRLSPILWTSIATGKTADKHGITGFVEPVPGGGGVRLFSSTSRKTKAIWNILSQKNLRSIVIAWYASHPAEPIHGMLVSNRFFDDLPADPSQPWEVLPGSIHPPELTKVVSSLRMHPAEWAVDDLRRFIPDLSKIDFAKDDRPRALAKSLARTVSVHAVATAAMEAEPWDFAAVYFDALDVAGHTFMPFHPPQLASVSDTDFQLYSHVMRELYLFHDELLGRLLQLAGEETHVLLVSDHGFHCDHLRPRQENALESEAAVAAAWHRHYGVVALRGPGIRCDERIYGANLLDIAPTLLTLFGLPIGTDMDGRPLLDAWENPPDRDDIATVSSWDQISGKDGVHPRQVADVMVESPEAIAQLAALGYLPADTVESQGAAQIALAESKYNLAVVHSFHGRGHRALELFHELHQQHPQHPRYAFSYAQALAQAQRFDESGQVLRALIDRGFRNIEVDLLMASTLFNEGKKEHGLALLLDAEKKYAPTPALWGMLGNMHLVERRWSDAARAFEQAVALDGDDPRTHDGLALAALQSGQYEQAADHALTAVGLLFFYPQAHFHLGMAFQGMGDTPRAIRSLELAVTQAPNFPEAHRELASLFQKANDIPRWLNHKRLAEGMPPIL